MGWLDCFIVNATRNQPSRAKKSLKSVLFLGNLTEITAKNYQTQKKLASEKITQISSVFGEFNRNYCQKLSNTEKVSISSFAICYNGIIEIMSNSLIFGGFT